MTINGLQNNYYFVHAPNIVRIESEAKKLEIKFNVDNRIISGTFYPINNKFKVDISQYTKLFLPSFKDERFDIGLNGGEVEVDYQIEIPIEFKLTFEDNSTDVQTLVKTFVHGISQPGEKNYLENGVHSIGDQVRVFAGYPFTINQLTEESYKRVAGEVIYLGDANEFATVQGLPEGPIYDIYKTPTQGVYLKWLDKNNNYSYWLFNPRKLESGSITNLTPVQNQINDITTDNELSKPSGVEAAEKIKIFSQIPYEYRDLIKTLFYSPEIYIYNLGYGEVADNPNAWSRVVISTGYEFKSHTKNDRIEIELAKITQPLTMKYDA